MAKRPYRILRNVRVDEVSAVDRGAGESCHVMLRKRDRKRDYEELFGKIFGVDPVPRKKTIKAWEWHPARKNTDISLPPADDDEGFDAELADDEADDESTPRFLAGSDVDEATGSTDQLERVEDAMEKNMTSQLIDLAKRYGWRTVCKNFVERGSAADVFSETEVTELLTAVARKAHPDLPADVAFAKAYSAQTADGELMRRTTQAARDAQFVSRTTTVSKLAGSTPHFLATSDDGPRGNPGRATLQPRVTGGRAARAVDNPKSALAQLQG
jgi:hypothetical protein